MLTSSSDGIPVLEPRNLVRRRFIMTLGVAAIVALIALLLMGQGTSDRLIGSGSTAAQPLIERLSVDFQNARSGDSDWVGGSTAVDYEPIGSLGGVMRLADPEVDFAVTDYPLSAEALTKLKAAQFPLVIGSIAVAYNLGDGEARSLRFSTATLAGIFSGRIASWDDPAVVADNPGVSLPKQAIAVVYRSDGSGSTFNWSTYLSRNAEWKARMGAGTTLNWPVGSGVKGGTEMTKAIAAKPGAIGYLETGQARRARLTIGAVQNDAGQYALPSEASLNAQRASAAAYPVVATSYVVMKHKNQSAADNQRTLRFLGYLLDHGSAAACQLGYVPLGSGDVAEAKKIWANELGINAAGHASAAN